MKEAEDIILGEPFQRAKEEQRALARGTQPHHSSGFSLGTVILPVMRFAPQEIRTYFVSFATAQRRRLFQVEAHALLMIETLARYREKGRFALHAFVVMPDHVHVLMTPAPDMSLEKAMQLIKGGFSYRLRSSFDVWERGYFEKRIPNRSAYEACVKYIHENPVKARIAVSDADYAFSSSVRRDLLDATPAWFESDFRG